MNILGKSLLLLIATMLVADPVMACCFPSAQDLEVSVTQTDKPPCHGTKSSDVADTRATTDQSCPGCGDCSAAMAAADHASVLAIPASFEDSDNSADSTGQLAQAPIIAAMAVPRFPSGLSIRSIETPISLKQRLLI